MLFKVLIALNPSCTSPVNSDISHHYAPPAQLFLHCHLPFHRKYSCLSKLFPLLHTLDVLSLVFLTIFLAIDISHPFCTSHPPNDRMFTDTHFSHSIPPPSICQSLDHIQTSLLLRISKRQGLLSQPRSTSFLLSILLLLSGDIHVNPGPTQTTLEFAHLNIRSATSIAPDLDKPSLLQEFISDQSLEILALSETWFWPNSLPSALNSITPPNFLLIHNPRPVGKGGGVAFLYRSHRKITTVLIPTFTSFESLCVKLSICSASFSFLTIYRPPSTSMSVCIRIFHSP